VVAKRTGIANHTGKTKRKRKKKKMVQGSPYKTKESSTKLRGGGRGIGVRGGKKTGGPAENRKSPKGKRIHIIVPEGP